MITSLDFVSDLIIFSKPSAASLNSIMKALTDLTKLINPRKSHIIVVIISKSVKRQCLSLTQMVPLLNNNMTYFGVILAIKKISIHQCIPLYEKITKVLNR